MSSLSQQLLEYEKKLLDPALRRVPERVASFLADDFVEFGSCGRIYDRKPVLFLLSRQIPAQLTIEDFRAVELASGAALVTYRARAQSQQGKYGKYSLRSSTWVQQVGVWKMIFHQGTMIAEPKPVERFPGVTKKAGGD